MFLQPPIILVVPGSTVPNLVHFDSGEDDDYDNENYGDHTAICRCRLVAMSNLRSPTSYAHIAHDQKNVKPNKTGTTRGRNVGTACTQRHTSTGKNAGKLQKLWIFPWVSVHNLFEIYSPSVLPFSRLHFLSLWGWAHHGES